MLLFIVRFQAKIQGRDEKKWVLNEETVQVFLNKKIKQNKPTNTKENTPDLWLGGVLANMICPATHPKFDTMFIKGDIDQRL